MATKGSAHHNFNDGYWAGWQEYRKGGARPVSLPRVSMQQQRIYSAARRKHFVSELMDLMGDWRSTPFEQEGPMIAGLRAGMCLDGNKWHRSNREAEILVNEALRSLGAKRPSHDEGQREYSTPPENCSWCGLAVPEELILGQRKTRFCSDVCARSALQHRDFRVRSMQDAAYQAAYETIQRTRHGKQACEQCGKSFRPMFAGNRFCSHKCSTDFNVTISVKHCPICQATFKPKNSAMVYCCRECASIARRRLPLAHCKGCGEPFRRRQTHTLYCSRNCTMEGKKRKQTTCTCECCGGDFLASTAKRKLCSKACEMLMLRLNRGIEPKKLTATSLDWLFHRLRREAQTVPPIFTLEIFDGWFERAA